MKNARLVRGNMMTSEQVVRLGYEGLMAHKRVVVPGFQNWFITVAVPFVPRGILLSLVKNLHQE
jgi:short-subunit dehydrogenase